MLTFRDYYKYAQLATAAYVDLSTLSLFDDASLIKIANEGDPHGPARMPLALATQFFNSTSGWVVLGDPRYLLPDGSESHDDPSSGFAATLFKNVSTGEKVLAIRGTDPERPGQLAKDLIEADFEEIGGLGIAIHQLVSLFNMVQRFKASEGTTDVLQLTLRTGSNPPPSGSFVTTTTATPDAGGGVVLVSTYYWLESHFDGVGQGVIGSNESITVVGHSLGGHLAAMAERLFPNLFGQAVIFNSPGYDGPTSSKLTGAFLSLFAAFGATPAAGFSNITSLVSEDSVPGDDRDVVTSGLTGTRFAPDIDVTTEVNSHVIEPFMDSIAVQSLMASMNGDLSVADLGKIFEAASATASTSDESLLSDLYLLLKHTNPDPQLQPFSAGLATAGGIEQRRFFYKALLQAQDVVTATPTLRLVSLVDVPADSLKNVAAGDDVDAMAYRYALKALNPFVVFGPGDFYQPFNQNGELNLFKPVGSTPGSLTTQYLTDRAAMLAFLTTANIKDTNNLSSNQVSDQVLYKDLVKRVDGSTTDLLVFLPGGIANFRGPNTRIIEFGTDSTDALRGRDNADHLYGGSGADALVGGAGDDYLEGDLGQDTLNGGVGNDTYEYLGKESTDVIVDDDGVGQIFYGTTPDIGSSLSGLKTLKTGSNDEYTDGVFTYKFVAGRATPGSSGTLRITRDGDATGGIEIRGFKVRAGGFLGIQLSGDPVIDTLPPVTSPGVDTTTVFNPDTVHNVQNYSGQGRVDATATGPFGELFASGILHGNDFDNYLHNGDGNDYLYGGGGRDVLVATDGDDELYGGLGDDALQGGSGDDYLEGNEGSDVLAGGSGADVLVGGDGADYLLGGGGLEAVRFDWSVTRSGNDIVFSEFEGFFSVANDGADLVEGGAGDDFLWGGQGDDLLDGGADNDQLVGDSGGDTLIGGEGNDTLFGDGTDDPNDPNDQFTFPQFHGNDYLDGGAGDDNLIGDGGADILLGGDGNDELTGDNQFLDEQFHGADYLDGGAGNDTLLGYGKDDTLFGGDGDDRLEGDSSTVPDDKAGNDYLDGGIGNDTLQGDGGSDTLFGGEGDDELHGDAANVAVAFQGDDFLDGEAGNDFLRGYGGDDQLFGGDGVDQLSGDAGADTLDGGAGNDSLFGGAGEDTLSGGDGDDVLAGDNGGTDASGDADFLDGGLGNDTLSGQGGDDTLIGGDGFDALAGGDGNDVLDGGAGNDTINGDAGNDSLDGGDGADHLDGGAGDDTILGGEGNDELAGRDGNDSLDGGAGDDTIVGEAGTDVLSGGGGLDQMDGGAGNDMLDGGEGNDTLLGGDGDDALDGGVGDDFLDGGEGSDVLDGNAGNDLLQGGAGVDLLDGGIGNDTLLGGMGRDFILGGDGDDAIAGDNGGTDASGDADILDGGAGNDTLDGQGGDDVLGGGMGTDSLLGGAGNDALDGGDGNDTLLGGAGVDHLTGGDGDDQIAGDNGGTDASGDADFLDGGAGNDLLDGQGGDDELEGGAGDDFLRGGDGNDLLDGGAGADQLQGGAGNDTLISGSGNDVLLGGAGDDVYVFDLGDGVDGIADLEGRNTVRFGPGVKATDLSFSQGFGTDGHVYLQIGYLGNQVFVQDGMTRGVASYEFADGGSLTQEQAIANVFRSNVFGTPLSDTVAGSALSERFFLGGGSDTLVFGRGSGADRFEDFQFRPGQPEIRNSAGQIISPAIPQETDRVQLGAGITPADVRVTRNLLGDLTLTIRDTGDRLALAHWSQTYAPSNEALGGEVFFADGTVWRQSDLVREGLKSTDDNDLLIGGAEADTIAGGKGDDTLIGGLGADTYLYGLGDGNDVITAAGYGEGNIVQLKPGITPEDVTLSQSQGSIVVTLNATGESLTFENWYLEAGGPIVTPLFDVDQIRFADGTAWDPSMINERANHTTRFADLQHGIQTDDTLYGLSGDDTLVGFAGNDVISGGDGNDILDGLVGGRGADDLSGGAGNDTLVGGDEDVLDGGAGDDFLEGGNVYVVGRGNDVIFETSANSLVEGDSWDVVLFDQGVRPEDVQVVRGHDAFDLTFVSRLPSGESSPGSVHIESAPGHTGGIEEVRFADGTVWSSADLLARMVSLPETLIGDDGDNVLSGGESDDTLDGGAGDDTLSGDLGADLLLGGDGNDQLSAGGPTDTATNRLFGGAGFDFLNGGGGDDLLDGGPGFDELIGFGGDDSLFGGDDRDGLEGRDGNDFLDGGRGDDDLRGGAGNDTYRFARNAGNDLVVDARRDLDTLSQAGDLDVIAVDPDLGPGDISVSRSGADLVIATLDNSSIMTVSGWFGALGAGGLAVRFADGTQWDSAALLAKVGPPVGTDGDDTLAGSQFADVLSGLAGNDILIGNAGDDTLDGGAGDDTLLGGYGNDTYVFGYGSGNDTIEDSVPVQGFPIVNNATAGGRDRILFAPGVKPEDVSVQFDTTFAPTPIFRLAGSDDTLTIEGWTFGPGRVEFAEFADGTVWDLRKFSFWGTTALRTPDIVTGSKRDFGTALANSPQMGLNDDIFFGLGGADTLTDTFGDNRLYGNEQNDSLSAGGGDDTLDGGSGNDTFNPGTGDNTIRFGRGAGQDTLNLVNLVPSGQVSLGITTVVLAQEVHTGDVRVRRGPNASLVFELAGTPDSLLVNGPLRGIDGRDQMQLHFADGTTWSVADVEARLQAQSVIQGGTGNNVLNAGDGNDTLIGAEGNDTLNGGGGHDTYLFSRGDGSDIVIDDGAARIVLGEGIRPQDVTLTGVNLTEVSGDLILTISGGGGQIVVQGWFPAIGGESENTIAFADGTVWDGTFVGTRIPYAVRSIDGSFDYRGGAGNDTFSFTPGTRARLFGNDGDDLLSSGDDDNTPLTGAALDDILLGGKGNDTLSSGSDNDILLGDEGDDLLFGGSNDDSLEGGDGKDTLDGGTGSDTLKGGSGDDILVGGQGIDRLSGDDGDDSLDGGEDGDFLFGWSGQDTLSGGAGGDVLEGGAGDDLLDGGSGDDELYGGAGSDTYVFGIGSGHDVLVDFDATGGAIDTVRMGPGLAPRDIAVEQQGWDLILRIASTGDSLRIRTFGRDGYGVERVAFEDGTVWDPQQLHNLATVAPASERGDVILGKDSGETLNGLGGDDTIDAGAGDDLLLGGAGEDLLEGGSGNDTLVGGPGADYFVGGAGADTFVIDAEAVSETINDLGAGDTVVLGAGISPVDVKITRDFDNLFLNVGSTGQSLALENWFANGAQGTIAFSDGTRWDGAFLKSVVDALTGGDDFFVGTDAAENIASLAGADTVHGGAGNDTIFGGTGSDALFGDSGNDLLQGEDGSDKLAGGDGDDALFGGLGDDALDGGSGNDILDGGAGNDTLDGGAGGDTLTGGEGVDVLAGSDGADSLDGGAGNDVLQGDANNDVLVGGDGDDSLSGGAGTDTLIGGVGNDTLDGGPGDDTYVFDPGFGVDTVTEADLSISDQFFINDTFLLHGVSPDGVVLKFFGTTGGTGSQSFELDITGSTDRLILPDRLVAERIEFDDGTVWTASDISEQLMRVGTEGNDNLVGFKGAIGLGGNDTLTGNFRDNLLDGGDGNDVLTDNDGNDRLLGGNGNDTLNGGNGDDTLDGGAGNDALTGGAGNDVYVFGFGYGEDTVFNLDAAAGRRDVLRLAPGIHASDLLVERTGADLRISLNAADRVKIDNWYTGPEFQLSEVQFADGTVLTAAELEARSVAPSATGGDDVLFGTAGNDSIDGLAGNDQIQGEAGADTLLGGLGNDTLSGGEGNDLLDGGTGDDQLDGGGGSDQLVGGDGNDALNGGDGDDRLDGGVGDDFLVGQDGNDVLLGGDGNDFLRGDDFLSGQTGNDTLDGGSGPDTLIDDGGNETFVFGRGYGADVVLHQGDLPGETDVVRFAPGVGTGDLVLTRQDTDLQVTIAGTTDTLALSLWFQDPRNKMAFQFADGTVWDAAAVESRVVPGTPTDRGDFLVGTAGADSINGLDGDDIIRGLGGNDTLSGGFGSDSLDGGDGNDSLLGGNNGDTLTGGAGNDTLDGGLDFVADVLDGGAGSDTYLFGKQYGSDRIVATETDPASLDTIQFLAGISPGNLIFGFNGDDLFIGLTNSPSDSIVVGGYRLATPRRLNLKFTGNATVLTETQIFNALGLSLTPSANDDLIMGTAGNDTINSLAGFDEIFGLAGNDSLSGGAGNDALHGGDGNDTLDGGLDDDILEGGAGNDVYVVNSQSGFDTVHELDFAPGNVDVVRVDGTSAGASVFRDSTDLFLSLFDGLSGVDITNWIVGDQFRIEEVRFSDGTVWNTATLLAMANGVPTEGADFLQGMPGADTIDGLGGDDFIETYDGDDVLIGGGGNDTLFGDAGNDTLDGGSGDDTLVGGGGSDVYRFGPGYGVDVVSESSFFQNDPDTVEINAPSTGVSVRMSGRDLALVLSSGDTLLLQEWFGNQGPSIESTRFADGVTWDAATLTSKAVSGGATLIGTDFGDFLAGFGGPDTLIGGLGNDFMQGGLGDDVYRLRAGDGADSAFDSGGFDAVEFDASVSPADVSLVRDPFNLVITYTGGSLTVPNGSAEDERIEEIRFSDGTVWDFDFIIRNSTQVLSAGGDFARGSSANDRIDGSSGDDSIYGGPGDDQLLGNTGDDVLGGEGGNDTLDGGTGRDLLDGGAGDDRFVFNSGYGDDWVLDSGGDDGVVFGAGLTPSSVVFTRDLSNLYVTAGTDRLTLVDWFLGPDTRVEHFSFGDGTVLSESDARLRIRPAAATSGDDTIFGSNASDQLTGLAGEDALYGEAGDDLLDGGQGSDWMLGGLGNDTYQVDHGLDRVTEYPNEGIDTVVTSASYTLPENVENLTLSGTGAINGTGNSLDNVIVGNPGANVIDGGAGNDSLRGDVGNDAYFFRRNDGIDEISDVDATAGNFDEVRFDTGILPSQVRVSRVGDDILLSISGGGEVFLRNWFDPVQKIESVRYADGTVWDAATIELLSSRPTNRPPVAVADNVAVNEDATTANLVPLLLANDTDPDTGDTLSVSAVNTTGTIGTVAFDAATQTLSYSADAASQDALATGETATDTFSYTVADSHGETSTAAVTVTVTGVNDAPVAGADSVAVSENATTANLVPLLLGNDTDVDAGDTRSITAVNTAGTIGSVAFNAATQSLTYSANGAAQDALAAGQTATDSFSYTVADAAGVTSTATVTVTVTGVNDAPVAVADSIAVNENATTANLVPLLLANDTDVDAGDTRSITAVNTAGTIGSVLFNAATQSLTYSANAAAQDALAAGQTATDSFSYTIADSQGTTSNATVTVTVTGVNDAPIAVADSIAVNENATTANLVPLLLANDTDVDAGDTRRVSAVNTTGTVGSVAFNAATQSLTYSANAAAQDALAAGQTATDSFTYTVADAAGATSTATVTVTVTGVNDAPVLAAPIADQSATENQAFSFQVPVSSFADVDAGDTLVYSATLASGAALPSWLSFNAATRSFTGTPGHADVGTVSVKVVATDAQGALASDVFDISVAQAGIFGTPGNDFLVGTANNDSIFGLAGDDTIDGAAGADTLVGGTGNDLYIVDNTGDVVSELPGEGIDTVKSSVTYTLSANVENLTLTGTAAINGTGNALDNVLTGNSAANVLAGGAGNDTYVVSTGDTVTEAANSGSDTVVSDISWTLGANLENLTLVGTSAINGTGNTLNNVLTGNSANNTLTGGAGNDTLDGGAGNDTMLGGAGDDTYVVNIAADVVTENANAGNDTIQSAVTLTLGSNVENLILTGTTAIVGTGNALNNLLRGNTANNTLNGLGGFDVLEGGAGNDVLIDTVGGNYFNGGAGTDTLNGGTAGDFFMGGAGNDTINTGNGADVIAFNAGDGQDALNPSSCVDDTLSLGGAGLNYANLTFQKTGNNLVLNVSATDKITFTNWYAASANKNVLNLQVVAEAMAGFNPNGGNPLLDNKIEKFNFQGLVGAFDAALAANPTLTTWALTNALTQFQLAGSDTAALGGDLAYYYGLNGTLAGIGFDKAQDVVTGTGFGTQAQTLRPLASLQDGVTPLS